MIKLFTHTDLDGVGCGILALLTLGRYTKIDISYCDYDNINSEIQNYLKNEHDNTTPIFITDISVNEETAELLDKSGNVRLLDHHPTALWLNKYNWCSVVVEYENEQIGTIKTSGTEMFCHWLMEYDCLKGYDYVKDTRTLERFAELVRDYDTWRWTDLGDDGVICKQINNLLYLYGRDEFIRWCISEIQDRIFPELSPIDKAVLKIRQGEIDRYIEEKDKTMFIKPVCNKTCGVVFADRYFSELGNQLCKMHPEIDFIAMIDISDCSVSYRTIKEDIDLGKDIASIFGGGGHLKAAGSRFDQNVKADIVKNVFG